MAPEISIPKQKRFYGKPDNELVMRDYIKLPVMQEVFPVFGDNGDLLALFSVETTPSRSPISRRMVSDCSKASRACLNSPES